MKLLESNDRIYVNSEIKKIEEKFMGYYLGAWMEELRKTAKDLT
jgi:hypothetical protein